MTISPCAPATAPQVWLEAVLRRHLQALPSVRLELGAQLVGLDNGRDRVAVSVCLAGKASNVTATYLVAADGAHRQVRRLLGIEMREREGAYGGVQAVLRAPLRNVMGEVRYALYLVTTATAPGLFLPAGPTDRWVYGPSAPPGEDRATEVDAGRLAHAIRVGAGVDDLDPQIEHVGPFFSPGEVAERFCVGRTLLTGDAAHRLTPRGGTGLNTAFQSGYDLGWKLAWILQGWAGADLLDTYETERRVVAEHNAIRSTDPNGSRREVITELQVELGGRIAHAWLPHPTARVSTLDLLGQRWTLFVGPAHRARRADDTPSPRHLAVRRLPAITARALGVVGSGALLTRPDGVPVVAGPQPPTRPTRAERFGGSRPPATKSPQTVRAPPTKGTPDDEYLEPARPREHRRSGDPWHPGRPRRRRAPRRDQPGGGGPHRRPPAAAGQPRTTPRASGCETASPSSPGRPR